MFKPAVYKSKDLVQGLNFWCTTFNYLSACPGAYALDYDCGDIYLCYKGFPERVRSINSI